jgi:hypothetical protein
MRDCGKSRNSLFLFETRATTLAIMLTFVFIAASAEATTNLLTNGNFETGNLSGWMWTAYSYSDPAMNPTVVTFDAVEGQPSPCFRVNPGPDLMHFGFLTGGVLSQTINLVTGTEYVVSVGAAAIQNVDGMVSDAGLIALSIGSSPLWNWDVADIGTFMTFRNSYSGTYTPASTGPYNLKLSFLSSVNSISPVLYHYVDNVSVVVPEPATVLLLSLGSLLLLRKRSV